MQFVLLLILWNLVYFLNSPSLIFGDPQAFILGSIVLNIYTSYLIYVLRLCRYRMYADDT